MNTILETHDVDKENRNFFSWLHEIRYLLPPNMSIDECKLLFQIKVEQERLGNKKNEI